MTETSVFQSNKTQAVRPPKDVAFPSHVKRGAILKDGERRIILPADATWDHVFDGPSFDLGERAQPGLDTRTSRVIIML